MHVHDSRFDQLKFNQIQLNNPAAMYDLAGYLLGYLLKFIASLASLPTALRSLYYLVLRDIRVVLITNITF